MRQKFIFATGLLALSLTGTAGMAEAQSAGSLDTTFGNGGVVSTSFGNMSASPVGAVEQANGDIVVAVTFSNTSQFNEAFGLVRYTSAGKLDTTFGNNGIVITGLSNFESTATAIVQQPNGDLLVAGTATPSSSSGGGPAFGLARYTSNGALDTTFGNGGTVTTSFGRGNEELTVLLLQPNGQIVVAGNEPGSSKKTPEQTALVRYNANGTLDTSFGSSGIAQAVTGLGPTAMALLSNGDYLVIGSQGAVAEFSSVGALLSTVSSSTVTASSATSETLFQSSGDFVQAGVVALPAADSPTGTAPRRSTLAELNRFTQAGTGDTTFNSSPFAFVALTSTNLANVDINDPNAIVSQANGQIIVGGMISGTSSSAITMLGLARVNSNGGLDTTFGRGGSVTNTAASRANSVLIQSDGNIVALGQTTQANTTTETQNLVLLRFLAN